MKNKLTLRPLILLIAVAFSLEVLEAQEKKDDPGRTVFLQNKCNACHSVGVTGIPKRPNQKAPDLSTIGSTVKGSFIKAFLRKNETLHDRKHLGSFKGNDEELETLVQWLDSLKAPKGEEGKK